MTSSHPRFLPTAVSAVLVALFTATPAGSHAVAVEPSVSDTTVIEVFIEQEQLRVEIETTVPHLVIFDDVFPDDFRVRMGLDSEPKGPRLARFSTEGLVIRADGGPPLLGTRVSFETRRRQPRDEITGEPIVTADEHGDQVAIAVLRYELDDHPQTLSFIPPPGARKHPSATIRLVVYHLGLPVLDLSPFANDAVLDLDWDDPWNSEARDLDLERPGGSPLGVFLTVEPYEVRVEIIARAVDFQGLTEIGIEGLDTIPVDTQEEVRTRVAEFLADHLELAIDGEAVTAAFERVDFLDRRIRGSTVIDPPRELGKSSATIGAVFARPTAGYPREVALTWKIFPDRVDRIAGVVADAGGATRTEVTREDDVLMWRREGRSLPSPDLMKLRSPPSDLMRAVMWASWLAVAAAAVVLLRAGARAAGGAGAWRTVVLLTLLTAGLTIGNRVATGLATVDETRAAKIVSALLHNVYRAFDAPDREAVVDTLERSVSGNLTGLLLETGRRLDLVGETGFRARVDHVELKGLELQRAETGFAARCTWSVTIEVSHWGHTHQRVHRVVADLRIEPIDGIWKITGMDLADEMRL